MNTTYNTQKEMITSIMATTYLSNGKNRKAFTGNSGSGSGIGIDLSFESWSYTKGMTYNDGSVYKGDIDRFGKRSGFGTYRAPIVFKKFEDSTTTLSSMLTWMEYKGEWCNDKPCGYGIIKRYRGDGTSKIIYEGEWINGEPVNDP